MEIAPGREQDKLLSLAQSYREAGYDVLIPDNANEIPDFLGGYLPDMIAEKGDDKVVIEVKETSTVAGSNELELLAKRVEAVGWRFELVTFQDMESEQVLSLRSLDRLLRRAKKAQDAGLSDAAYVFVAAIVESELRDLAKRHGVDQRPLSVDALARRLVTEGVISGEVLTGIRKFSRVRNQLAHSSGALDLSREDIEALQKIAHQLRSELTERKAA